MLFRSPHLELSGRFDWRKPAVDGLLSLDSKIGPEEWQKSECSIKESSLKKAGSFIKG